MINVKTIDTEKFYSSEIRLSLNFIIFRVVLKPACQNFRFTTLTGFPRARARISSY